MPIPAIPPLGAAPTVGAGIGGAASEATPLRGAGSFGELLSRGLEHVSDLERSADRAATGFAVNDGTKVHEVMTASAKSQLAVEMLAQLRNRAVEAYAEIMRLQV